MARLGGSAAGGDAVILDITVIGTPRTKGSWRPIIRGGKVRMLPQTAEKPWAMAVAWSARDAGVQRVQKPHAVVVVIEFTIARPKKSRNEFPVGDADKLARSVLDALTGIAWDDDVQVVDLHATKAWGDVPGARIRVQRQHLTRGHSLPHTASGDSGVESGGVNPTRSEGSL